MKVMLAMECSFKYVKYCMRMTVMLTLISFVMTYDVPIILKQQSGLNEF